MRLSRVGFDNCDFYQVFEREGSTTRSHITSSELALKGDIKSAKARGDWKDTKEIIAKVPE